jgi:hypothetical protein
MNDAEYLSWLSSMVGQLADNVLQLTDETAKLQARIDALEIQVLLLTTEKNK